VPLSNFVPRGFGFVYHSISHSLSRSAKSSYHDSQLFRRCKVRAFDEKIDYYSTLGVDRAAATKEITKLYKKKVRIGRKGIASWHGPTGNGPWTM
jgi:uncharacterized Rmd1/YagE family protein